MIVVAFRSVFFLGVIMWYSSSVMNLINDYFGKQFSAYLDMERDAANALQKARGGAQSKKGSEQQPQMSLASQVGDTKPELPQSIAGVSRDADSAGSKGLSDSKNVNAVDNLVSVNVNNDEQSRNCTTVDEKWWVSYWKDNPNINRSEDQEKDTGYCSMEEQDSVCDGDWYGVL